MHRASDRERLHGMGRSMLLSVLVGGALLAVWSYTSLYLPQ
jgi:hypothetical protein